MEYYEILNQNNGVFAFDYNAGRGHFSVNIESFLEIASSRNFKDFLDIVNLSSDPFRVVSDFQKIIIAKIADEKELVLTDKREKLINKLCGFLAQIEKAYGIVCPEEERKEEKTTLKKCEVLAMIYNSQKEESEIHCFSGFKFSKFGYNFFVYKNPAYKKGGYHVLLACNGISFSASPYGSRQEAVYSITEKVIENLEGLKEKQPEKYEKIQSFNKKYIELVKNSNFYHLFDADFCAVPDCFAIYEESQKEESAVMPSTKKEETATVAECLQVEKEPGKNYNRLEKVFSILKRTQRPYKRIYISIAHSHTKANKTPRNALKTARNDIVLCPCLLDFSKNGKWITENADFSHTGLFTTVFPLFSVGYSTGKSPPGGYQKFLPYFEF